MRRLLTLVCLLCLAIPAGISVSGCTRNPAANYCNGEGFGLKITDVASINLQPQTTGISLAFGQTQQVSGPTAKTCKGTSASVTTYTYGTTNNQLVDISPTGNLCAGTWNRNTGGGIANYTYCNLPNPMPNTSGLPYGTAYITASAAGVTSNPVEVYVHPQVTAVSLVGPQECVSQSQLWTNASGVAQSLDAQACYEANGKQYELCAPAGVTRYACSGGVPSTTTRVPTCPNSIGPLTFTVGTPTIATINNENNEITAEQPGTTVITASVAGSGSSAGYFSTCPPQNISLTLANGATSGTITQGVQQNLVTTVTDTRGNPITGLTLDYQSTNPLDTTAGSGGGITADFPGTASIFAVCQPTTCNPSPINEVGLDGTGLSISSNPVTVTTPGTASSYMWFAAPGKSQYFTPIELLTGTPSPAVRMPYVPNSMMMDQLGNNLYFGSSHELMIYSTTNNSLAKEDPTVPGMVLAVSPNNSTLLINDQARHVFYLYSSTGIISATYGGMGVAAAWTPDSKTLYIVDNASVNSPTSGTGCSSTPLITGHTDTLYVYNDNSNWTTYSLPPSPLPAASLPSCTTPPNAAITATVQTPAVTNPGVGAYRAGDPTVAHTWCPAGTAATASTTGGTQANITSFYPLGDSVNLSTDVLAATIDGHHILGASLAGASASAINLSDIGVTIPSTQVNDSAGVPTYLPLPCTQTDATLNPLEIAHAINQTLTVNVNADQVRSIVTSPAAVSTSSSTPGYNLAFITYTGSSPNATLPYFEPGTSGKPGTLNYVTLSGASAITAPVAGAFSPDNTLFFVSTSGDNKIHYISVPTKAGAAPKDTQQLSPNLPACVPQSASDPYCTNPLTQSPNSFVPATVIVVKPRSTT
jgi:hypothetical protein